MSDMRYGRDRREEYAGRRTRLIRGAVQVRELTTESHTGERAIARGRAAADGSVEESPIDNPPEIYGSLGLVARPAGNDTVAALVLQVGGSGDHMAVAGQYDSGRSQVIAELGLDGDELILYRGRAAIKIDKDGNILVLAANGGTVEIRSKDGSAQAAATKADVDAVNARVGALQTAYNAHIHGGVTTGMGVSGMPATPAATGATVIGTSVLRVE